MNEQLNTFKDISAYIIGTVFLLWAYIKSLKENTFDGKTYMHGFLCSLAKYGLVAPTLVILALSAFILSVCGWAFLARAHR
mgnify:FL=1